MEYKQVTVLYLYQEHNDKTRALMGKGCAYSTSGEALLPDTYRY